MVAAMEKLGREPTTSAWIGRLRAALSSDALVDGVQRHWPAIERDGRRLVACEPIRVHPRGGDAFVVEYDAHFETDGGERVQPIFGELSDDCAQTQYQQLLKRLRKPLRGQLTGADDDARIGCIAPLGLVLRVPGLDERLHGLRFLHQPWLLTPELSRLGLTGEAERDELEEVAVDARLLGHRLGKRCVVRFRLPAPAPWSQARASRSLVAKMYKFHSNQGRSVADATLELRRCCFGDGSELSIPKPLAYLTDWRMVLMEHASGTPVANLADCDRAAGVAMAGHALTRLHDCRIQVDNRHTVDDEIALLERWVRLASALRPDTREPLSRGFSAVANRLRRVPPAACLVHRDFHDKQVLVSAQGAALIDFDTLCMADPALDIGNFIAHLRFEDPHSANRLEAAFLDGYGLPPARATIDAFAQATLLRLACIHGFCESQRGNVERVLEAL